MLWIGIIIGIIIGVVATIAICTHLMLKWANMTSDEYLECIDLVVNAGQNREAAVQVWHDGELIDAIILEEK